MLQRRTLAVGACALLLWVGGAAAQPLGGGYRDLPLEPSFHALPGNIEILRLENGLEVVLLRNPAQPMVGIYTQVKVGSAREDFRTNGMSHMLEHLLFNGTEKWTQEELYALTDRIGAYNNANTSDFYTNYMTVVPARELAAAVELQAQMLFHSLIPAEKFAKEQGIVLGELVQSRDWPGRARQTMLRDVLFAGSSLALPTLGTRATIANLDRDDVHAFYKAWYVPNNMVLTVAGNFDRERILALLEEHYGTVPPGEVPDRSYIGLPHIEQTRAVTRRAGDERTVALAFEAPTWGMADFFPYLALSELLTLEGSGLLSVVLDQLDEAVRPDVSLWWEKAPGFGRLVVEFTLPAGVDPGVCYSLLQDAAAVGLELGIADEDLLGVVRMAETQTLLEREQLRMTGISIAETVVLGGVDAFVAYLDGLRSVSGGDVMRALNTWLVDMPCVAVLIEPEAGAAAPGAEGSAGMPAGMQMPPAMARAMAAQGGGDGGAPEPAAPVAAGGQDPAAFAPLPVERSVLANGGVLVSQTNPESEVMALHLTVRGRATIDAEHGAPGALDMVHRLLAEGYAGCDRTCLARELRALGAVTKAHDDSRFPMDDYYTNGRFSFLRMETGAANGRDLLALLTREIQHAAFDDDAFERVRADRVEALGRKDASARATADRLLAETLYGDHPLALPPEGSIASLESLEFDQVRRVYRRAFSPENLVLAVVGPLGHDELRELVESDLPGRGRPADGLPPLTPTAAPATLRSGVGGEMGAVRLGSILAVAPEDRAALRLAVAILRERIGMDLRETRGLSYSVGSAVAVHGDRAEFEAWINPPVERLEEGRTALREAVTGFDAADLEQDELDRIRSARVGRLMMRRLSSMGQAYYLAMAELDGDLGGYLEALTAFDEVTVADVRRVAATYLQTMPLVEVVVD